MSKLNRTFKGKQQALKKARASEKQNKLLRSLEALKANSVVQKNVHRLSWEKHFDSHVFHYKDEKAAIYKSLCKQMLCQFDRNTAIEGCSIEILMSKIVYFREYWHRTPETWSPKFHSTRKKFSSLLQHVFCKYKTPMFLEGMFFVPTPFYFSYGTGDFQDRLALSFIRIAQGHNVKSILDKETFFSLTKKAAHILMTKTSYEYGFAAGVRRAQALAAGCQTKIAEEIASSSVAIETVSRDIENFIGKMIQWFSLQVMLDPKHVRALIDYLLHLKRTEDIDGTNRGINRLLTEMQTWHAGVGNRRHGTYDPYGNVPEHLPVSGLKPYSIDVEEYGSRKTYSVVEIVYKSRLRQEGTDLGHCIYSYVGSIVSGRISVFTLMCGQESKVTIEVSHAGKRIMQARGKSNRKPTDKELNIMGAWASFNNITLGTNL